MSEMQSMLADTAARLFEEQITPEVLARAEAGDPLEDLWTLVQQQGFDLALAPEEAGGSGLDWCTVYPLVLLSGKFSLPLPLAETLLATWLLGKAGLPVPQGRLTVARLGPENVRTAAQGGQAQICGSVADVPWAAAADHIVLCAELEGAAYAGVIAAPDTTIDTRLNIAREPRCTVSFGEGVPLELVPLQGVPAAALTYMGAMLRSAQMAGAAERLLQQSVQYADERVQFGRRLSAFQIIQQHIAVIACEAAAMSAAASYAFSCADGDAPELAIAAAKIRAGTGAGKVASLAHAVHGAIGFTYEHTLHYSSRRLWAWRSEYGSHAWWSERLGRAAIAAGPQQWWPALTRGTLPLGSLQ